MFCLLSDVRKRLSALANVYVAEQTAVLYGGISKKGGSNDFLNKSCEYFSGTDFDEFIAAGST